MKSLLIERIGPRDYILREDFISEAGITVPAGFRTDGISLPAGIRWILSPTGHGFNAALVHDYLLSKGHPWRFANERFEEQLMHDKVPILRRKVYVLAVNFWGFWKQ